MNVVVFGGSAPSTTALTERLGRYKQTAPIIGGGMFIKMEKAGTWVYGAEGEEVLATDEWAVNPHSFQQGYICWDKDGGSAPLGEVMYSAGDTVPPMGTMEHYENGKWSRHLSVDMVGVSKDVKDIDVQYKTNSVGGVRALNDLVDSVLTQAATDPVNIVPVLNLKQTFYKHQKYGKIFTPVLHIVRWMSIQGEEQEKEDSTEELVRHRRKRK